MYVLQNQRGMISLMTVLMASMVSSVLIMAVLKIFVSAKRSQLNVELQDDISAIRRHLVETVDCSRTLAQDGWGNPLSATYSTSGEDCDPSSPFQRKLVLRDRNNNLLTSAFNNSNPMGFRNKGKIGNWYLHVQCDRITKSLIIQAARPGGTPVTAGFAPDPYTGRVHNWTTDPLYVAGGSGIKICQDYLGGANNCTPGSVFPNCQFPNFRTVTADLIHVDTPPSGKCPGPTLPSVGDHWMGTANCPTGYRPVSGGGNCQIPDAYSQGGTGGYMLSSGPTTNGNGWTIDCCGWTSPTLAAGVTYPGAMVVTCVPQTVVVP